ncbi:glycosyltransferase [Kushneria konosiri]|uniref:Glycosyltransferase 2-like domain-containing protein n=1 Tax=Kushneria konosiri TaxID=698828 RepID=A0A2Z2H6C5_9GAMM|nr:glycosyltransferase family A protein [Kushneria konosiri]ARS52914.1 hypothetical protein B9G99_08485 [Kushneria konosiri]
MTTLCNALAHIGVVVPAHDEEQHLGTCLASLLLAADHARALGHDVTLVVVLDSCQDRSATVVAEIAESHDITIVNIAAANVGVARHAGVQALPDGIDWLAFTDADTHVSNSWLTDLYGLGTEVVCGGVYLVQWQALSPDIRARYLAHQRQNVERQHIHGANMGISMAVYRRLGGFRPLRCHEDVDLIERHLAAHGNVTWAPNLRVMTSARHQARAPNGLGALLQSLAHPSSTSTDGQTPLPG